MSEFERVHAALVRARRLVSDLQKVLELPFCPVKDVVILDGLEAINEISAMLSQKDEEIAKLKELLATRASISRN